MKNSPRIVLGALTSVVLLAGSTVFAQTAMPEAGLIGKRYAGADFTYDHFTGSSVDHAFGAVAVVNAPLRPALDLTVAYSYLDTAGNNFGALDKNLSASLLTHRHTEYGTGYFAGTLGHTWSDVTVAGLGRSDHGAFWGVRAGYEFAVAARSAVNLGVGYTDAFENANKRATVVRVYAEANHWFSRDVAGVVSISYRELRSSPDSVSYMLGLRWAF